MTTATARTSEQEARRRSTVVWVVGLAFVGLVFDGYDLVVYGTVLSTFLRDPTQIGPVTPAVGGALGSYALVGVLVGALLAGTVADVLGRRKVMLLSYAWFSVGMAVTALMTTTTGFGLMRFVTGLGVGALVATTGAMVSEFAPPGKKNLCNAIVYWRRALREPAGRAAGHPAARRRSAGGACSGSARCRSSRCCRWRSSRCPSRRPGCSSRGRVDEARALSERTGVPLDEAAARRRPGRRQARAGGLRRPVQRREPAPGARAGVDERHRPRAGLRAQHLAARADDARRVHAKGSLSFLLVLNGGAVVGALIGSRIADRFGPKPVVAACFLIGAVAIALLTLSLPLAVLLLFVAIVGLGTSGTQTLIYGFVANYFRTNVRGAAWRGAPGSAGSAASAGRCSAACWSPPAWR